MSAIAIDFETANHDDASACSVGLVWIANGSTGREEARLINPGDVQFVPSFIDIHGITPEMVSGAESFGPAMAPFLQNLHEQVLFAHNADFDSRVLDAGLRKDNVEYNGIRVCCTLEISRKVWPSLPNHRLNTMAAHLGLELDHHDALSDSRAAAGIVLAAAKQLSVVGVDEVIRSLDLRMRVLSR